MQNHTPYNEKELLLQVAEGDQAAFRQLFLHWSQLLAGYVLRITESRELTEEIVQDVFMKIWMVRETLTGIKNFKHFLLVVSRNQAFDLLKKQLKEQESKRAWEKEKKREIEYSGGTFTITDTDGTVYIFGGYGYNETTDLLVTAWKCILITNANNTETIHFDYEQKAPENYYSRAEFYCANDSDRYPSLKEYVEKKFAPHMSQQIHSR